MGKYRRDDIVIEAIQFTGNNIDEVMAFIPPNSGYNQWNVNEYCNPFVDNESQFVLKEGEHQVAEKDDWIVKALTDEVYVCKNNIFSSKYKQVEENGHE